MIKATVNLICFLLIGCATTPMGPILDKELLDFLVEGKTTRQIVIEKLGQPSGTFENSKILTYRIGSEDGKIFFVDQVRTRWVNSKYSLVLVFDKNDILIKKSLVSVR